MFGGWGVAQVVELLISKAKGPEFKLQYRKETKKKKKKSWGSGEFQIPSFLDFGICAETLPVKHLESKMLRNLKLYFFEC
jgi:hypothetical protein